MKFTGSFSVESLPKSLRCLQLELQFEQTSAPHEVSVSIPFEDAPHLEEVRWIIWFDTRNSWKGGVLKLGSSVPKQVAIEEVDHTQCTFDRDFFHPHKQHHGYVWTGKREDSYFLNNDNTAVSKVIASPRVRVIPPTFETKELYLNGELHRASPF